jgi:hypothetical protein
MKRTVAAALLALALAPAAHAASPVGAWTFETAPVNQNCKLSGDMQIWKTRSGLACRFTAVQACTGDPPIEIKVAQTCIATQAGQTVTITSKIDRTLSVKPQSLKDDVDAFYAPDNFAVTLNATGDEMTGLFRSLSEAFVRFSRRDELVS